MTRCIASVGFLFLLNCFGICQELKTDVWRIHFDRQEFALFKFQSPSCLSCTLDEVVQTLTYQDDEHIFLTCNSDTGRTKAYCLNFNVKTKWLLGERISILAAADIDSRDGSSFYLIQNDKLIFLRNGKEAERIQLPILPKQLIAVSSSVFGILSSEGRLEIYNSKTGDKKLISENVSIIRKGGAGQVLYMQTMPSQTIFLKSYDIVTSSVKIIGEMSPGIKSFTRLDDGSILGVSEKQILLFHPQRQLVWKVIADLSFYGIQKIEDIQSDGKDTLLLIVTNN